jgi:hypothetical protein
MDEIWITIKDFENYQVSNLGRIRSLYKNIVLKPQLSKNDYLHVILYKNKFKYTKTIHVIVAKTFIPNPLNLPEVNHIDGNKNNCAVTNLEWSTKSDNAKHAYRIGLKTAKGENNGQARLTNSEVIEIRELKGKLTQREIAQIYNVTRQLISCIHLNKNWKNI